MCIILEYNCIRLEIKVVEYTFSGAMPKPKAGRGKENIKNKGMPERRLTKKTGDAKATELDEEVSGALSIRCVSAYVL